MKKLTKTMIVISLFCLVLRLVLSYSTEAAELFYRYITRNLQAAFAFITSPLPFSLGETLICMLPVGVLIFVVYLVVAAVKGDVSRVKKLGNIAVVAFCAIFINFILNLSVLYCRPSLSEMSGIENTPVSVSQLEDAVKVMSREVKVLLEKGDFLFVGGASKCPYGFDELSVKIEQAYSNFSSENDWISPFGAPAKQIALSDFMTYTHLAGIHTQFTGEANVNVNYPDYVVVSTMAHEKAHQRGIAPEDEANIVAMMVLCQSGDAYLEYCGYMSVFSDVLSALYRTLDTGRYSEIASAVPYEVFSEMSAYADFFGAYRDSAASAVADTLNDSYLKLNGEREGVKSYGLVVDMAVDYFLRLNEQNNR